MTTRCTEPQCAYLGQPAATSCRCARATVRTLERALEALRVTAGNIRSLRASGALRTYDEWLSVVEAALEGDHAPG